MEANSSSRDPGYIAPGPHSTTSSNEAYRPIMSIALVVPIGTVWTKTKEYLFDYPRDNPGLLKIHSNEAYRPIMSEDEMKRMGIWDLMETGNDPCDYRQLTDQVPRTSSNEAYRPDMGVGTDWTEDY